MSIAFLCILATVPLSTWIEVSLGYNPDTRKALALTQLNNVIRKIRPRRS